MKALVTGGSGFLGLYITEQLLKRGDQVRVLCRRPSAELEELAVEWRSGDVRDRDAVISACDGMDAVFHTAALAGIWGPRKLFQQNNVDGTHNVIEACRRRHVPKLIYTSTASVVFDGRDDENVDERQPYSKSFLCEYPRSKAVAEKAVLEANGADGLATAALRPHLIWGPRDNHLIPRLIERARSGRLRRIGAGTNLVSTIYVENAAAAHLQAADALGADGRIAGEAYFINEPEPVNLWQWIDELLERAGLPRVRQAITARAARWSGVALETIYRLLPLSGEPAMTRFLASQLSVSHYYNVSKARQHFRYSPPVTMEEGMRRLEPELRQLAAAGQRSSGRAIVSRRSQSRPVRATSRLSEPPSPA